MMNPNLAAYPLVIYSDRFRWEGIMDIPAHRRLSDYVAEREMQYLILRDAKYSHWEGDRYGDSHECRSAILIKQNISVIIPGAQAPRPPNERGFERVEKVPVLMRVHVPPLRLEGSFHRPPVIEWFAALKASRADFVPLTQVNVFHYESHTQLSENLDVVLMQASHIVAYEPLAEADTPGA